ncbi:MAG: transposase [Phycisphaerae bacterium]
MSARTHTRSGSAKKSGHGWSRNIYVEDTAMDDANLSSPADSQPTTAGLEQIKRVNPHGAEYWSAHNLQILLGYSQWRRFEEAITRALASCTEPGNDPAHHFASAGKMIALGKGGNLPMQAPENANADILSTSTAGGTPRNAGILPAPIATPAKLQSSRRNPLLKRGWHSRGYLPHGDPGNRPIHLVLRLYDSLPKHLLARWEEELRGGAPDREDQRRQRIEAALDQGIGACWLKQPNVARIVADALNHFNGDRYTLHAWVIMPNHVHALTTPAAAVTLSSIMHSWKSFTAKQANGLLERTGQFWMEETYDRVMRNRKEVIATKAYIEQNPVAAGLCGHPAHWPWSSACTMAAETNSNAGILPASNATQMPAARNSSSASPREPEGQSMTGIPRATPRHSARIEYTNWRTV